MKTLFRKLARSEKGATAIEYGLIAALIAVVLIGSLGAFGNASRNQFTKLSNAVGTAR